VTPTRRRIVILLVQKCAYVVDSIETWFLPKSGMRSRLSPGLLAGLLVQTPYLATRSSTLTSSKMRITVPLILPCFFHVLLTSGSKPIIKCDEKKKIQFTQALQHAVARVEDSLLYLREYRKVAPRFKKWFGDPDHEKWQELQTLFQNISKYIPSHGVYRCSQCKGDGLARARAHIPDPKRLGQVVICPPFWNRPPVGRDSKAGIIIHEWSHFDGMGVFGGTEDLRKTLKECERFAEEDPYLALQNSHSIQHFAENDPPLD